MKRGTSGAWGAACLAISPFSYRRLILTGTPAPNGVQDLQSVMSFVWPGLGRAAVTAAVGTGDLRIASERLRPMFVRTTKLDLDLPPVNRTVRRLPLPPLHRELYQALVGDFSTRSDGRSGDLESMGRIVLYLLMAATSPSLLALGASRYEPLAYRVPPLAAPPGSTLSSLLSDLPSFEMSPKYAEVASIVASNATDGRKTLVWSTFVRNLTTLSSLLAQHSPAVVHGGTLDRMGELHRFRTDARCHVLLTNPATLGEAISLHQTCNDAVYVDRDFAAGRFMQSLDRIHRLGLRRDVDTNVTLLVSDQTIDEVVEARLAAKVRFMGTILDDRAVLELGDFDEEPSNTAGMDNDDLVRLVAHLHGEPAN